MTNKVFAVIPVFGRLPLVKHTITRLLEKNGVHHVICVGWEADERYVCEKAGAEFIYHKNVLGGKLNAGFEIAGAEGATHILFVGSSDFVSDNYLEVLLPLCPENGFVGTKGCYMAHIIKGGKVRAGLWHGYNKERNYEPIGIGRIIGREAMELCHWNPFNSLAHSSMDGQLYQTVVKNNGQVVMYDKKEAFNMCISTDQWRNMHKFGAYGGTFSEMIKPYDWLNENFPETLKIF
jgi:hypothetical protein